MAAAATTKRTNKHFEKERQPVRSERVTETARKGKIGRPQMSKRY